MNAVTRHFGSPNRRRFFAGMTLVEMIVAVAILSGIILIVNALLASARRAVIVSQAAIVANADARAVVERLRADLAGLTNEGFLGIRNHRFQYQGSDHYAGQLIFTTVGPYRSVTSAWNDDSDDSNDLLANSGIIYCGHAMMPGSVPVWDATAPKPDEWVLMRRLTLMTPELSPNASEPAGEYDPLRHYDYHDISLSLMGSLPYLLGTYDTNNPNDLRDLISRQTFQQVGAGAPNYAHDYWPLSRVVNPSPGSLCDVRNVWPYLVGGCSNFLVEWTDGSTTAGGKLQWFGGWDGSPDWKMAGLGSNENTSTSPSGDRYFVDFTFHDCSQWPKALRITFVLGEGDSARPYEVIVGLPR